MLSIPLFPPPLQFGVIRRNIVAASVRGTVATGSPNFFSAFRFIVPHARGDQSC